MSDWINYVKKYAAANNMSYKEALKEASPSYYKLKKTGNLKDADLEYESSLSSEQQLSDQDSIIDEEETFSIDIDSSDDSDSYDN